MDEAEANYRVGGARQLGMWTMKLGMCMLDRGSMFPASGLAMEDISGTAGCAPLKFARKIHAWHTPEAWWSACLGIAPAFAIE